jgi:hypothetical protein
LGARTGEIELGLRDLGVERNLPELERRPSGTVGRSIDLALNDGSLRSESSQLLRVRDDLFLQHADRWQLAGQGR